jgi:hypothetical protein
MQLFEIDTAAEAIKLRDAIRQTIMPLLDSKPMGVISAALTGICANFIAGCPPHARGLMRDILFSQIDAMIPIAVEVQKAHGNAEDRYTERPTVH